LLGERKSANSADNAVSVAFGIGLPAPFAPKEIPEVNQVVSRIARSTAAA
jgi:hypothetical protein